LCADYEAAEQLYVQLTVLYEESVLSGNPDYRILEALETAENASGRMGGVDPEFWERWNANYASLLE